jgi:hypothetical protein
MSDKVAEIKALAGRDNKAAWVANLWDTYNNQRASKINDWIELRNYIFATDTTTTSNSALPWKNSTTLPKLTQIRDNLHSNYLSSLFPNDKWLQWKGYTKKDSTRKKAKIITAYMENKTREARFRQEVSRMLYDYIDYGNAFATVSFEKRYNTRPDGSKVAGFIGPRGHRISPHDIVFNPLASTFEDTFKIIRSLKTIGELKKLAMTNPEHAFWEQAIANRLELQRNVGGYSKEDFDKSIGYSVDGFGSMYEYLMSDYIEILEFFGDHHDAGTGVLSINRMITIADRSITVRDEPINTLDGRAPIRHVGWRLRPDNLWAMGPLENLVGMQYRIDHLENLKADAMDLSVHPPLMIIGEVEEFIWGPGAEIHLDENGSVQEISKNLGAIITSDTQIRELEAKMELYAGAPREAMGVRSPGEKTAFEVQKLDNAASRIFQEKITAFETSLLEPNLNDQLEIAIRNFDGVDIVRTIDTSLGFTEFTTITIDDISASGVLRPVGARHFGEVANELQNIIGIANSPIWPLVQPHTSAIALTRFVEDVTAIAGYEIFRPNVAIQEQKETQALMNQASEDLQMEASVPPLPTGGAPQAAPQIPGAPA